MSALPSTELVARLLAVRRRVRRRLVAYGVFAVVGGGALALLTVITLDWFLWLPGVLRALGLALFVAGYFGATYHWIVKPLRARLSLDEIAGRLERHFKPLGDRLSSSVNFLEGAGGASEEMARAVITDTERMIRAMPLESALSLEPVAVRGSVFGVSMVLLLVLFVVAPHWVRMGVRRYASPWGGVEWPKRVQIVPLTRDQIVPLGESASVAMRVSQGLRESLRGLVYVRSPDGSTQQLTLQRDAEGTFFTSLDSVTASLEYWFEAGDDSTERWPATITVVQRPEVVEVTAVIGPPAYATSAAPRVYDLLQGPITAVRNSTVSVSVRSSKPIPNAAQSGLGLVFEDDTSVSLTAAGDPEVHRDSLLQASFVLERTVDFHVELRDEYGLQNRGTAAYRIVAQPDAAPQVTILSPQSIQELTALASLPLTVRVEDDLGIRQLRLQARTGQATEPFEADLSGQLRPQGGPNGVPVAIVDYPWSLSGMRLSPGDMVTYEAAATDNYVADGVDRQVGRSNPQQIRIISETEFDLRLREQLAALEARIRQAALEQQELRDRTDVLSRMMDAEGGPSPVEASAAASLGGHQVRLGQRVQDISAAFGELADRMEQNQAGEARSRERLREIGVTSRQIAAGSMNLAEVAVAAARDSAAPEVQRQSLDTAVEHQGKAADELRALLGSMSAWGTFQGLVSRTRDLLDRQTDLQRETADFGKDSLGKPAEALSAEESAALTRLHRQQEQLSADVDQHLARMRELAESLRSKQPAASDSMDSAIRAARANQLDKHLQAAGQAIAENRMAAAALDQRAAADALRRVIASLREREKRELEELRKRIVEAEEQVTWLLEHEVLLQTAAGEAGLVAASAETFAKLEAEQRTLARNTTATAEELSKSERTALATEGLRRAVGPMEASAQRLADALADSATKSQQEAIDLLRQTLVDLQEAARLAEEELVRRSLEHLQDSLAAILEGQLEINEGVGKLAAAVVERGDIGRAEARQASKLAREQSDTRELVAQVLGELTDVPVYEWALERTADWMDGIRASLEARQVDADVVDLGERVARELQKLIGALAETLALPAETEFAEAEGASGGSPGDAAGAANVPPVAELLVLKAIQTDINERTRSAAEALDPDAPTGEQLRELSVIAEDQAEVRRLTELVVRKARPSP